MRDEGVKEKQEDKKYVRRRICTADHHQVCFSVWDGTSRAAFDNLPLLRG